MSRSLRPVLQFAGVGLLFTAGDVPLSRTAILLGSLTTVGAAESIAIQAHVTIRRESREQKKQLLTIADNLSDGIYGSKPAESLLFANQAFVDMFGFGSVKEALAADPGDLYVNPERRTDLRKKAKRDGSFKDTRVKFQRTDGSQFHGLISATVERTPDGTVKYYDGAVADLSKRVE